MKTITKKPGRFLALSVILQCCLIFSICAVVACQKCAQRGWSWQCCLPPPSPPQNSSQAQTWVFQMFLCIQIGFSSYEKHVWKKQNICLKKKKSDYLPDSVFVGFPGVLCSKDNGLKIQKRLCFRLLSIFRHKPVPVLE